MVAELNLPEERLVESAASLLGGAAALRQSVRTRLEAHDLLRRGLPIAALDRVMDHTAHGGGVRLDEDVVLKSALGISRRTYQRWKQRDALVGADLSSRIWMFASLLAQAAETFGSHEAALSWFRQPALALDGRTPITLLETPAGQELVRQALTRIDYGVYT